MQRIEKLLQEKFGLGITSVGKSAFQRAINKRMQALNLADADLYLATLQTSGPELNELVEEIVVPETWFFRETMSFIVLTSYVAKRLQQDSNAFIRLLSAPCSSGEEAYSMAIALMEANIPAERFSIHGLDISSRSLVKAGKGIYRQHSFREKDLHLRYKYFHQEDNFFVLKKSVMDKVRFRHGNILNADFIASLGTFDVLFCRNVLIYLDDQSCKRALNNIEKALTPEGILFVGHAESGMLDRKTFRSAPYPKAFAFYKNLSERERPPFTADKSGQKNLHDTLSATSCKFSDANNIIKYSGTGQGIPRAKPKIQIDQRMIKQMVDEGKFEPAADILRINLQACGPTAEAYYLLGMISIEKDKIDEANNLLRKAVYLSPDHIEALALLSMLAEKSGDALRVQIFEERIARLQSAKKQTPLL
jgi:chemotaxis protein methyltransferase WspC